MKTQRSSACRLLYPAFILLFFTCCSSLTSYCQTAEKPFDPHTWQPPYQLPMPGGWNIERFVLPPGFAPSFTFKGVEDIRFHPGWADSTSQGYWSYTYLWWLDGTTLVDAEALQRNFQAYYDGLIGSNIVPRKIPADKVFPTRASVKKTGTAPKDRETYAGTIRMLDYMAQRPMVLNVFVHVKEAASSGKKVLIIEVSPRTTDQPVWNEMDAIQKGFR